MRAWILLCFLLLSGLPQADEPTITVSMGNDTRSFTQGELLARPDATTIEVAHDVTFGVPMTYRAVPVASLLAGMTLPPDSVIETVALDGFIAQLPSDLVFNTVESKAVAWLAIEPADHPWPPIPGRDVSAGPFYMVWTGAEVGSVRSEQWPFQMAKLVVALAAMPSRPFPPPWSVDEAAASFICRTPLIKAKIDGRGASESVCLSAVGPWSPAPVLVRHPTLPWRPQQAPTRHVGGQGKAAGYVPPTALLCIGAALRTMSNI